MMSPEESIRIQLHLNATFTLILIGRVDEIVKQLAADKTPEMQLEITVLKKIYEKFLEAKPLIQQLQDRGKHILHAKTN